MIKDSKVNTLDKTMQTEILISYLILECCIDEKLLQHLLSQFFAGLVAHEMQYQQLSFQEACVFHHRQHGHPEFILQAAVFVHLCEHHECMVVTVTNTAISSLGLKLCAWLFPLLLFRLRVVRDSGVHSQVCTVSVDVVAGLALLHPLCSTGEVLPLRGKVVKCYDCERSSKKKHKLVGSEGADPTHGSSNQSYEAHISVLRSLEGVIAE